MLTSVAAVVLSCGAVPGWAQSGVRPVLSVEPSQSLLDTPVEMRISGLAPHKAVVVRVSSRDAQGTLWSSAITYIANAAGEVSTATSGPDPMAPFDTMSPTVSHPYGASYWWSAKPQAFDVQAVVRGKVVASTAIERSAQAPGETVTPETVAKDGFFGDLYQPPGVGKQKHLGIVIFGGSEGGLDVALAASLLAAHGYPTLALAYFKEPGLPQTLSKIPLEYFARAISWFAGQHGVNPRRIFVSGDSRGSEAALLLGADFPSLVAGVIANVPSNVALCSLPNCTGPAWTLDGKALPYTQQVDNTKPTDAPNAVIPVEKIRGPIFLDCGGRDLVWDSCPYAKAIASRSKHLHSTEPLTLLAYPRAGHGIGSLFPYEPFTAGDNPTLSSLDGSTPDANALADANLWPKLLAFLRRSG